MTPTAPITFYVHGPVASQGSMSAYTRVKRDGSTGVGVKHDSSKTEPWRAAVGYRARQAMRGRPMLEGPLSLSVTFFLPRPKSAPKSRTLPCVAPDLDKLCRAIGDALERIVYVNDSQIVDLHASKLYATKENPVGAMIVVRRVAIYEGPEAA